MVIKIHPKFTAYEFDSETGKYRKNGAVAWLEGKNKDGKYLYCSLKNKNEKEQSSTSVHRALWTCFNGDIEEGKEIDHVDDNILNNKLSNLQCITINENRKKRNHDFLKNIAANARNNMRKIKGINLETKEEHIFKTKSNCAKYYGCSPALIYYICEKKNRCKTFQYKYTFEYVNDDDIVVDTIVPDARIGKKYNVKEKVKTEKVRKIRAKKSEEERKIAHKNAMKKYQDKKKLEQI